MKIQSEFRVRAPRQRVWNFLVQFERLAGCVPGVEEVKVDEDGRIQGVLAMRMGAVAVRFAGSATIEEEEPPDRLQATFQGRDRLTGSQVSGRFRSLLREEGETTRVEYSVDVNLTGRLAQFGHGLIEQTTLVMTDELVSCLRRELEHEAEEGAHDRATASAGAPTPTPSLLTILWRGFRGWISRAG